MQLQWRATQPAQVTLGDQRGLKLHRWKALVVFDLDGTLLRGPTVCEVLAESLGRLERMRQLERFASEEELRTAREEMARWYLPVGLVRLREFLDGARFAPGTRNGLALLRAHSVAVGIASITWSFAVEHFARLLEVEHWEGTALEESGEIHHVWPEDKAPWVRRLAQRLEVPWERTAAVGDSAADQQMLGAVGFPVFVGRELPSFQQGWLHYPAADIEAVARHLPSAGASISNSQAGTADGKESSRRPEPGRSLPDDQAPAGEPIALSTAVAISAPDSREHAVHPVRAVLVPAVPDNYDGIRSVVENYRRLFHERFGTDPQIRQTDIIKLVAIQKTKGRELTLKLLEVFFHSESGWWLTKNSWTVSIFAVAVDDCVAELAGPAPIPRLKPAERLTMRQRRMMENTAEAVRLMEESNRRKREQQEFDEGFRKLLGQ